MKELRISAVIHIPDEMFEHAEALLKARPVVDEFRAAVEKLGGTIAQELVTPRAKEPAAKVSVAKHRGEKLAAD